MKLTTVANMKIRVDGITSGKFNLPAVLRLRIIVVTALAKSVKAIPDRTDAIQVTGSTGQCLCPP